MPVGNLARNFLRFPAIRAFRSVFSPPSEPRLERILMKLTQRLLYLAPLAGRGRPHPSLPRLRGGEGWGRGRGPPRESELVERPPHPDPLHSPSQTKGRSRPSSTGFCVNALMASGEREKGAVQYAISWLLRQSSEQPQRCAALTSDFASSGSLITMPDIGSIQVRWLTTDCTPGIFSAQTLRASPWASSVIVPHNSTAPSLTMTSISATGAHVCLSNSTNSCSRIATSVLAGGGAAAPGAPRALQKIGGAGG